MRRNNRSRRGKIPQKEYTKHAIIRRTAQCLQGVEGILPKMVDEPTGNLDSKTSMDVILLMQSISRQFHQTTIMITHNEEIAQMADRTIRIEDGKVVSGGVRYAR